MKSSLSIVVHVKSDLSVFGSSSLSGLISGVATILPLRDVVVGVVLD
jgi:hypothetical protein